MKQQLNEQFDRMQKLAGIITENQLNEDMNAKFKTFKQYVYDYLKEADQMEDGDELDTALKNAKDFNDIEKAIGDYWGWEDEQTVWMLASFIQDIYIKGKTKYSVSENQMNEESNSSEIPLTAEVKKFIDDAIKGAISRGDMNKLQKAGYWEGDFPDYMLGEFGDEFPEAYELSKEVEDYIQDTVY